MIHSARPTVSPVANIVFALHLFCFEEWGRTDRRTNGRHVQKQWSLPAVEGGSASWINILEVKLQFYSIIQYTWILVLVQYAWIHNIDPQAMGK